MTAGFAKCIPFSVFKIYIFFFQISLQMQQLLEPSLHSESWNPVKIKFNWDASYWTKQVSSLGKMNVIEARWLCYIINLSLFSLFKRRLKREICYRVFEMGFRHNCEYVSNIQFFNSINLLYSKKVTKNNFTKYYSTFSTFSFKNNFMFFCT